MAKRGETRPYRVRYEWDNGIKGTETHSTEERARGFAAQLCRNSNQRGFPISITIQHQPTDEED